jgi:hypothetical protein
MAFGLDPLSGVEPASAGKGSKDIQDFAAIAQEVFLKMSPRRVRVTDYMPNLHVLSLDGKEVPKWPRR